MGGLYQFRFEYDAEQDRVLFRLSTTERAEYLIWLTRRYVKLLLEQLGEALDSHPDVARQASAAARQTVSEFRREAAVQKTDLSKKYEGAEVDRPLGDEPILATRLRVTNDPKGPKTLHLSPKRGKEIGVTLTEDLLHSFLHLLAGVVAKAEWDLGEPAREPARKPKPQRATLH